MDPDALDDVDRVPHGSSDDPAVLDFSANVNTRTPAGTREVYAAALSESRSYPPEGYSDYRAVAAEYAGCDPGAVVPTAGGLAAIRLAVEATVAPGDSVLLPAPSFGEYAREVALQGATPEFVSHDSVLDADPEPHALAVVCNPNNPTGDAYDPDDLRAFAARCRDVDTPLLVDEAFLGFTADPSLAGEPGVVVARSLTKLFGLPGLRAGFAVARGRLRDRLRTAAPTWGLGWPAARVGAHAMRDEAFVRATRERVATERARMRERLATRFSVHHSDAPFLLFAVDERWEDERSESSERASGRSPRDSESTDERAGSGDRREPRAATREPVDDVAELGRTVREAGIAIRDATTFRGLDSHVRVAVREPAENDRLLDALDV